MLSAGILFGCSNQPTAWTEAEAEILRTLWIGSLPELQPDPSNQYGDDTQAASLGEKLFFDTRFSSNGEVACATCHDPEKNFQDGLPRAQGVGTTNRRAMPIAGTAYNPWLFWDGRKDSQWAQALGPLESPVEHGGTRTQYVKLIQTYYKDEYEAIFGALPDFSDVSRFPEPAAPVSDEIAAANWEAMSVEDREAVTQVYANMGKAIAAYERTIMPGQSRFDQYVKAVLANDTAAETILTDDEIAGLKLFIGDANCTRCHNGALFTDNDFHNTGVPPIENLPEDTGRTLGAPQVLADEFNCLSKYSDASPEDCSELKFMLSEGEALMRAFKPPSLRDVALRAPYMHAGQFTTLEGVLNHYNEAPAAPMGHTELEQLFLSEEQLKQIIAFLKTLSTIKK
ncbi:MAG: methylamine utilization protein [Chloroflexi bacterium]|nr:methylamine utilization protein [Chloroflexota bacterium]